MDADNLKTWCRRELSELLGSTVEDEFLDYLLNIESEKDLMEYVDDMVGSNTSKEKSFSTELVRRWNQLQHSLSKSEAEVKTAAPLQSYNDHVTSNTPKDYSNTIWSQGDDVPSGKILKENQNKSPQRRNVPKQKLNFVPLMSKEGQSKMAMYLPGRHSCQCLAVKHELVNNCVKCGRIVCTQEGSGPCLFCGALVCSREEEEWMTKDSKKARKLREQFFKKHNMENIDRPLDHLHSVSRGLDKALHHRNKLLEFDQTSASRTKVIDDESDYFSVDSNRWLSASEKEALRNKQESLREQKYGSRRTKAVTLDIMGKKVVEEEVKVDVYAEEHARTALARGRQAAMRDTDIPPGLETHAVAVYNPAVVDFRPQFIETTKKDGRRVPKKERDGNGRSASVSAGSKCLDRLQDRGLQEMKDEGLCLSMHQPWASLLVHGIKKAEGRGWYSTHRGRLWIAATSQVPDSKDILRIQQFYMDRAEGKEYLEFPLGYPSGCLLGCVDMQDCLPQDEYREQYPEGESESEFVFVVDCPQQLTVKFPVKGKHKIWKLDKQLHAAAKKGLKIN